MTVVDLLSLLEAKGISLALNGDQLAVRGDKKALADAGLVDLLRQKKAELIAFLQQGGQTTGLGGRVAVPPNGIPSDGSAERITPEMVTLAALTQDEIDALVAQVAGGTPNIQDIYPLAPLQEGMLFHHLVDPEHDAYVEAGLIAAPSRERLDSLLAAIQRVIDRHDILRTSLVWQGVPEPLQVVSRQARLAIEEIALDPSQGEAAAQLEARLDPRNTRFDLTQAPLIRAWVAEDVRNGRWLLRILSHHLVLDHTTQDLLVEEAALIEAGRASALPAAVPFRNFVAQARLGVSEAEHEAFFRDMLGDIDEPTAPFGLLDVQGDGSGIEEARLRLDPALALAIRAQARRLGVSAASLMHLAWSLVLARTTGRADVVFGTVLLGRMHAGEQAGRIMGLFINTLPFRVSIDRRDVPGALRQVQALLGELIAHEHAPLALAQRCSAVDAQVPLFTSLLNYRHAKAMPSAAADEEAGEDDGIELRVSEDRTNYPLTFSIDDLGDEFVFTAQVSAPVDPQRVCDFMQTAVTALLAALEQTAPAPLQALSDLDVLPAAERERVLPQQGALPPAAPVGECLHTLFEACVQRDPQATAVRLGEGSLSYDALNRQANRLARHLRGLGVGPDTPVAICVERGFDMIVALLAVLKAGGAYVPLDPAYASERLHFTVEDSRPVAILADAVGRAALGEDFLAAQPARVVDLGADAAAWADAPDGNLPAAGPGAAAPAHLAYVIYTSGSTGRPKGVMVEHRNVVRLFDATAHWFRFDETDVWTLFHSFSFDFSVWEIWGPLLHGGSLVIVPLETARSPRDFHALLCEQRVTVLNQTPSAFLQLSAAQGQAMDEGEAGRHSLRYVVFGGEALELRTLKPWYERNGHDTVLINMYGITETTVHVTYRPLAAADTARPGPSPIGEPIPDLRLYVLDGQCRPAPVGTIGELYVGGAGVARGYLNRPELTSERFIANPYADGERLYRSGDLGRWLPDGTVEYLGRNDFQVKIRGFRIELGEIEAKLAHCPEVQEVVVLAREDQPGEKRLVAYYIGTAAAEELRTLASANLPPYMVPVAYVRLDGFPLTPNGKLDRRALPAPEGGAFVQRAYEAPEGETEEKLAAIWAELLKLERVGRHDNFFDLGGHSLLVVRLVERMRSQSMFADIRILFTAPTLAELAAAVSFESSEVEVPANLIPELPEEAVSDGEFEEFRL